jgi:hypothetical protein
MKSEASLLHAQLRRMRAMNYKYHALFFRYINFWILICVGLLVVSLWEPLRPAAFFVPPLVLYAAMQGAFHFHYIIFSRRYARTLEQKLNALAGKEILIANRLEDIYIMPLDAPRFVGFSFGKPAAFFSGITLHYGIAGTFLWALGLVRALWITPLYAPALPLLWLYVPAMLVWTLVNMAYLAWYFIAQRDEKQVQKILDEFVMEAK